MAKFVVEEVIRSDSGSASQIWARLRQYVIMGKSVELVRRSVDGEQVIEVRRWKGIRNGVSGSNKKNASPETDY